jgi:hypothetical protein
VKRVLALVVLALAGCGGEEPGPSVVRAAEVRFDPAARRTGDGMLGAPLPASPAQDFFQMLVGGPQGSSPEPVPALVGSSPEPVPALVRYVCNDRGDCVPVRRP